MEITQVYTPYVCVCVPNADANITNVDRKVNDLDVPANYVILTYGHSSLI